MGPHDVTGPLRVGTPDPNMGVGYDDVTVAVSRDPSDVSEGVDFPCNVDCAVNSRSYEPSPGLGECSNNGLLEFYTPLMDNIQPLPVFERCLDGACTCCHLVGDRPVQLKTCRAAQFLFGTEPSLT